MNLFSEFLEWFFVSGEIDGFNCPHCRVDLNPHMLKDSFDVDKKTVTCPECGNKISKEEGDN